MNDRTFSKKFLLAKKKPPLPNKEHQFIVQFVSFHSSWSRNVPFPVLMIICIDVARSTIRPLLSGTCFHLQPINGLPLLLSEQISKHTSSYSPSIIPDNPSSWPAQLGKGERRECVRVCACIWKGRKLLFFSRRCQKVTVLPIYMKVWQYGRSTWYCMCA